MMKQLVKTPKEPRKPYCQWVLDRGRAVSNAFKCLLLEMGELPVSLAQVACTFSRNVSLDSLVMIIFTR